MVLVIGCGSLLRADDAIGQIVAGLPDGNSPSVETITSTQLTPELAEPISKAERVVFIDAAISGAPGAITVQRLSAAQAEGALMHHVTPEGLLSAAGELYDHMPEALLISVAGASFDLSAELSPLLRMMLPDIMQTIWRRIADFALETKKDMGEK